MTGKDALVNVGREILWLIVLVVGVSSIWNMINIQYVPIGDPNSIDQFRNGLIIMLAFLVILTLFWWWALNIQWENLAFLRRNIEQYSFQWSLAFVLLAILAAGILYFRDHIIFHMDLQRRYALDCIFILPLLFTGLMYAFPPLQITRVVVPGMHYKAMRVVFSGLAFAAAAYLFATNFLI